MSRVAEAGKNSRVLSDTHDVDDQGNLAVAEDCGPGEQANVCNHIAERFHHDLLGFDDVVDQDAERLVICGENDNVAGPLVLRSRLEDLTEVNDGEQPVSDPQHRGAVDELDLASFVCPDGQ